MLDIAIATRSERGQRARNEDSVRVCRDGAQWLAVLADGAGGHHGGAEASQRAVAYVDQALHDAGPAFEADALTRAVVATHRHVLAGRQAGSGLDHMHSTVVVLWIDGASGGALWSHVGDSRLYVVRRGVLPKPIRLSTGCVRWSWMAVEASLASLAEGADHAASDPFLTGVRNAAKAAEGRRGAA